jgi:hypothetical protein
MHLADMWRLQDQRQDMLRTGDPHSWVVRLIQPRQGKPAVQNAVQKAVQEAVGI